MTKSKTWEEEFDEKFGKPEKPVSHEGNDEVTMLQEAHYRNYVVLYNTTKDFIRSQIEKTRREEASVTAGYCELAKQDGFKAGLQRAIELVPEDKPDRTLAEHMAFQDACMRYVENLKKELNE